MEFTNYTEILIIVLVISSFSVVQTLFGVGLLVFGTPTLLLLGYPFTTSLFLLLPSSILLSALQIYEGKSEITVVKDFLYFSIPPMLIGLFIIATGNIELNLKLLVGIVLILISILRKFNSYNNFLLKKFILHTKPFMALMGIVHGISNQGGGLLTLYFSTIHSSKLKIRSNIAFCYFTYGVFQLALLLIFHFEPIVLMGTLLAGISVIIYYTLGGFVFNITSENLFGKMISITIFLFGLTLIYGGLF